MFLGSMECKVDTQGLDYVGHINFVASGTTCQRWDAQIPHTHGLVTDSMMPEGNLSEAENYCRNPDGEPNDPWCYTVDPNVRWTFCDIPLCQSGGMYCSLAIYNTCERHYDENRSPDADNSR